MKKKIGYKLILVGIVSLLTLSVNAQQIGVNTDYPEAILDVVSDNSGILIPRISLSSTTDITTVPSPALSELIYNTATAGTGLTAVIPAFYYWNGSLWVRLSVGTENPDEDWHEAGGLAPDDINDNIYTQGNVAIGLPVALEQLHVAGNIRVDGDTIMTVDNTSTKFVILSNGGVVVKLDGNDDGSSDEFSIKKSGQDLNSKVFTVTEGGNTNADGWGVFGDRGEFNGDVTIRGNSRDLIVRDNFDIIGTSSVDIFLDSDANNAASSFAIKNDSGNELLAIAENGHLNLYPYGTGSGETGGLRLRELTAFGLNYIEFQAPDVLGNNYTFTWPNTDGATDQFLQTDGNGVLDWTTINVGVTSVFAGDGMTNSGTASDPILNVSTDNLTVASTGTGGTLEVIGLPPGDNDYIQNQNAVAQSGARYRIQGDGTVSDFNVTGGDIYGPGLNYGSNSILRIHSQTDVRIVLDGDNNGSQSFQLHKNGSGSIANRFFEVFETGNVQADGSYGMLETGTAPQYYTRLQSGDLSSNMTLTFPPNAGNAGDYLQTNGIGTLSWDDGNSLRGHNFYEVGGTDPADNISDDIYTQGDVGIGTNNPAHALDVRGYAAASNMITTIPLWQAGSIYTISNTTGEDLMNCEAGFDPLLYDGSGDVEVRLVIRITTPAIGNLNFQLRTHDGTTEAFPITNADAWTFANTQTGQVAISPWKDWSAGANAHEIHLNGWVNSSCSCTAAFNSAYLQVRPNQP